MTAELEEFGRIYDDEVWSVFGFFAYRLDSRADAEDLTQATFERALRAWDHYDEERAGVRTWLLAIARNLLIDHHRRGRSDREEPLSERPGAEHAAVAEPDLDIAPDLTAALGRLRERERELIALRYGADMTGPEIAELLDLSLANVQQILSRSLRRMRAELEHWEPVGQGERPGETPAQ
jgi:RNA polymerase sigma-70 factor (ECF subfamily)